MNAAVTVATFALSGPYSTSQFLLSSDGNGGTDITVAITPNQVSGPDLGLRLGAGPVGADNWSNANHPMFAGVALPGSTVVLYDGATTIGNGQTNAQGVWTITARTLPLGTNRITAVATDSKGYQTTSPVSDILMIPGTSFQTAGNENANFQAGGQNNTFQFGNGAVVVVAGDGSNQVTGGDGGDTVRLGDGPNNKVSLGNGNDSIQSGNGKSTVTLGNGNDTVVLGNGNDTVTLGNGTDTVRVGNGNDTINLGAGNYRVATGTGKDSLVFAAPQAILTMPFSAKDEVAFRNSGFDLAVDNGKGTHKPQEIDPSLFGTFPRVGDSAVRFAYDQGSGELYYSPNGNVASETLVAHLTNVPHLTADNLYFIS
jgi:serralysin